MGENSNSAIENSYATGDVDGGVGNNAFVGGLIGIKTNGGTETRNYYNDAATVTGENIITPGTAGTARTAAQLRYPSDMPTSPTYSSGTTIASFEFTTPSTEATCNALLGAASWSSGSCNLPSTQATCEGAGLTWTSGSPGSCGRPVTTYAGWDSKAWDFGTTSNFPALRSYKTNDSGTVVQGDLICGQPAPRAQCE